ncbi:MAG: tetratricopeptide repeat protein [Desulfuromusa sp.]|nr:tetratricopeptide repeat protein [Desulfuromusa sp.]
MSLINEMLRDLEKRHRKEGHCLPCSEAPVAVNGMMSAKLLWIAGGILLLAAMVWIGVGVIPDLRSPQTVIPPLSVQQEVVAAAIEEDNIAVVTPAVAHQVDQENDTLPIAAVPAPSVHETVIEKTGAELRSFAVVEDKKRVQLSLTFAQRPEYRLVENGSGTTQLVVEFNQTHIGAEFKVPELSGGFLKRVSLVPQEQTLQLLIDLEGPADVQGFQFAENTDQEYRLLIEVVATLPVVEIPQKQVITPKPAPLITEEIIKKTAPVSAGVSKNRKPVSRDQQAYRTGLKRLKLGRLVAAEASFNQALLVNPNLLDARLQLIKVLQQQKKLKTAESVLQTGLTLTPGNLKLRKIYARLLLNSQRQNEAIELLKTRPLPGIVQDLEYYALLAALYQDSGEYEAATAVYAQLLKIKPQVSLWWMGMAISLEQSGSVKPARDAYQKALELSGLSPDLRNYIHGRLQEL